MRGTGRGLIITSTVTDEDAPAGFVTVSVYVPAAAEVTAVITGLVLKN
jgi:molybdopterin-binding protein